MYYEIQVGIVINRPPNPNTLQKTNKKPNKTKKTKNKKQNNKKKHTKTTSRSAFISSLWIHFPPLRLQAKQLVQYSICLSIISTMWTSCGAASFMPSRNARVMCIVSLFLRLGLPFRTSIFIVIFLLPLLSFSADIFIINTCGSHVNPCSVEWIFSMLFSLIRFWRMVAVTRASSTLYSQFLCTQYAELAGCESEI